MTMTPEEKQFWTEQFNKLGRTEDKLYEWAEKHGTLCEKALGLETKIDKLIGMIERHITRGFWHKALDRLIEAAVIFLTLFLASIAAATAGIPIGEWLRKFLLDHL